MLNHISITNNITEKDEKIEIFLNALIPTLAEYKNPAFYEENEIRPMYCDDPKFELTLQHHYGMTRTGTIKRLNHDFRTISNNDITEYVKLDFNPIAIESICIGPKCRLSENDILSISKRYLGKPMKVTVSKASYC